MDISLDNPGFQVDVADVEVHQVDVPKSSSGSSSSGEAARRSCTKCHGRMSSFLIDIFFVQSVVVLSVLLVLDARSVFRGPRRRWKVMLN